MAAHCMSCTAVRRERLLAEVESVKSVEELREVVATLIKTLL